MSELFSSASYELFDKMLNPTTGPRSFGFIYCVLSLGFLVLRIEDLSWDSVFGSFGSCGVALRSFLGD